MICLDSNFLSELVNFWFNNQVPKGLNSHLIFAITTFFVSVILVLLNQILVKTKGIDLIKLDVEEEFRNGKLFNNRLLLYILWVFGSFLISFILTTTEIVNIKIISSVIVGFTWDKLFIQLSKMTSDSKNPQSLE